jgi:D-alanine-D-alanine ligase-like ATP-grasp enzyme
VLRRPFGEHEVSLTSAAAVFQNLDRNATIRRHRIEKDGRWTLADTPPGLCRRPA